MSDSALEAPSAAATIDTTPRLRAARVPAQATWWLVTVVLIGVSIAIVAWTQTAPSYDAYGWLVWGYQTLHGKLDLGGAPSWKPLPFLFTVPYALFALHIQRWLWMVTAVGVDLAGALVAGRVAYRLTLAGSRATETPLGGEASAGHGLSRARRNGALLAGVAAAVMLLGTEDYAHYILSMQSDPMIVTFTLAAIDSHLSGRPRLAIVFGVLASLGRPEAWPFLALYGLWCWLRVPGTRLMLLAGIALIAFMWFGIPTITNGRPFVSAQLALHSPRELKQNQVVGTLGRFFELSYLPVWIAALLGAVWALVRRDLIVLGLCAIVTGWVIVEIAFALHGWPALPRYMFEAGAIATVVAGVAVGWALTELPRLRTGIPRWAGLPVVAALMIALVPGGVSRIRTESRDLRHERGRAKQIALMGNAISSVGGWAHLRRCAKPVADVEWVSALAWLTRMDVGVVGHLPHKEVHVFHHPILLFTPLSRGGWHMVPYHLHHHNLARCLSLRSYYAIAPGHPDGALFRY